MSAEASYGAHCAHGFHLPVVEGSWGEVLGVRSQGWTVQRGEAWGSCCTAGRGVRGPGREGREVGPA